MKENQIHDNSALEEAIVDLDQPTSDDISNQLPQLTEEPEAASKKPPRVKKKIILILSIAGGALIVIPLLLALILNLIQKDPQYVILDYPEYEFAPVYEGDILHYSYYLGKDRDVLYYSNRSGYGEAEVLNDETSEAKQRLLYSFVQSIICGDEDLYNSFFNQTYYASHEPQKPFAQQMLYHIRIYLYSIESMEGGDTIYTYQVDYMIAKNNGTYRNDIGSDMSRSQYVSVRETPNGNASIEDLILKRMAVQVK